MVPIKDFSYTQMGIDLVNAINNGFHGSIQISKSNKWYDLWDRFRQPPFFYSVCKSRCHGGMHQFWVQFPKAVKQKILLDKFLCYGWKLYWCTSCNNVKFMEFRLVTRFCEAIFVCAEQVLCLQTLCNWALGRDTSDNIVNFMEFWLVTQILLCNFFFQCWWARFCA